jgi:hypothetical protein
VNYKPFFVYMEVPRTGSTTVDRALRQLFPMANAPAGKHWPVSWRDVIKSEDNCPATLITVRNPYARAVSCYHFFTDPAKLTFEQWLRLIADEGFTDINIEAGPQILWWRTHTWRWVLHTETLQRDFNVFLRDIGRIHAEAPDVTLRQNNKTGEWNNRIGICVRSTARQELYTPIARELVEQLYREDFELGRMHDFDWSFDSFNV